MVESAGELLAAARYWSARSIAESDPDHARLAAQLVAGSRQAERDAWELAAREAAARPRDPQDAHRAALAAFRRAEPPKVPPGPPSAPRPDSAPGRGGRPVTALWFPSTRAGERWYVDTTELRELCEAEQAARVPDDACVPIVRQWLGRARTEHPPPGKG